MLCFARLFFLQLLGLCQLRSLVCEGCCGSAASLHVFFGSCASMSDLWGFRVRGPKKKVSSQDNTVVAILFFSSVHNGAHTQDVAVEGEVKPERMSREVGLDGVSK